MPVGLHLPDILILVIILLIFGSKKLPETGAAIGKSIIAFKKGLSGLDEQDDKVEIPKQALLEQQSSERKTLERDLVGKEASLNAVVSVVADPPKKYKRNEGKATIYERLKTVIVNQLHVDESKVVPGASFIEDLNADSLDLVELVMSLEEEFHLPISDKDARKITTVQEAADYLKEHLSGTD